MAILGGAKVSDKIPAIRNLAGKVDTMLVGGAMAYTLLAARGGKIGASRCEEDILEACRDMLAEAESAGTTVLLPTDHVVAAEFSKDAEASIVSGDIPDGLMGLDIGPKPAKPSLMCWPQPRPSCGMVPWASLSGRHSVLGRRRWGSRGPRL